MNGGQGFHIPSLFDLAKRVCIRNVNHIDDIGDLPYSVVKPILERVVSPRQLKTIEKNCPQLVPETNELWQIFIRRDVGREALDNFLKPFEADPSPESQEKLENTNWSTVYFDLYEIKVAEDKAQVDALKNAIKKHNDKKEKRQIGFANVRKEDVRKLRMLDKGKTFIGFMDGRVSKGKVFRNSALNKALTRPGAGRFN
ncbi:hypothetical protein TWF718_006390 [Orbilia javanica]|uniref:Elongin-A n=1 Tax=Orbilia javanica TaxID=47235 RepID=A0AAN8MW88_9PEZI